MIFECDHRNTLFLIGSDEICLWIFGLDEDFFFSDSRIRGVLIY